jgi:hypothetical protein
MRYLILVGVLALAITAAVSAPVARAHTGTVSISCTGVTFTYADFPASGGVATESYSIDGGPPVSTTFTFSGTGATHTVPISIPSGTHTVTAQTNFSSDDGVGQASKTKTLSGCTPPTQTIAGHIYDCRAGTATTTEVPGGTLGATGPQSVPTQSNPLGPTGVAAGTYTMTASSPAGYQLVNCNGVSNSPTQSVVVPSGGAGVGIFYVSRVATCPQGTKANFRWHYSANGTSGSWSGTKSAVCPSSLTMGPQAMEGDLKLTPGTTLKVGYDFTVSGNKASFSLTVSNAQVVFTARCVSGATPSASTFTVPMSNQTYAVTGSGWYPSGDQHSSAVYQGSISVPNLCAGGQVRLDKGGTFSANVS